MFLILLFLIYVISFYYLLCLAVSFFFFFWYIYVYFQSAMTSAITCHAICHIFMADFWLTAMSRPILTTIGTKCLKDVIEESSEEVVIQTKRTLPLYTEHNIERRRGVRDQIISIIWAHFGYWVECNIP